MKERKRKVTKKYKNKAGLRAPRAIAQLEKSEGLQYGAGEFWNAQRLVFTIINNTSLYILVILNAKL